MTSPNIGYVRPEVTAMIPRWNLIRDCLSGAPAVKAAGETYLPKPNKSDTSEANEERYEQYVERAVFYGVTQRTHAGLVGQVFQQEPTLEVPTLLEALRADVDGAGVGLVQQAKKTLGFVLAYGRAGLLSDYPKTDKPASREDIATGKLRPTIALYDPWSIINWRTKTVGARQILTLVVISEYYQAEDDGFEVKAGQQYRVLSLEPDIVNELGEVLAAGGTYRVGIWRQPEGQTVWEEVEYSNPTDAAGKPLREIPFCFVGAVNNDPLVDLPPMYDLSSLNIAHYRNSADYEEMVYICGQATPWAAGLTQTWVDKNFGVGVQLGSRAFVPLPVGGSIGLIQASPNSMPKEAMDAKERQMVALGAKLIEQRQVQRTLGEARLEYATEISVLGTCAKNVASAYGQALKACGAFVGESQEARFEVIPEFELGRLTAQERAQLVAEWQAKAISFTELRDGLRNAGIATQEDEDAKAEIDSEPPSFGPGVLGASMPGTSNAAEQQTNEDEQQVQS